MNDVSTLGRTNDAVRADRTSSGKAHFEVLDGLRGSAAFLIVAFHIIGIPLGFNNSKNLFHHAYLLAGTNRYRLPRWRKRRRK
jgi:hypothetical protein